MKHFLENLQMLPYYFFGEDCRTVTFLKEREKYSFGKKLKAISLYLKLFDLTALCFSGKVD
jgi:hypothetical protein